MTDIIKKGKQFLIFAGTKEGRELAEFLDEQRIPATVCVATEYGEELIRPMPYIQVHTGRMDEDEMEQFMRLIQPLTVIDATHPYASEVTQNIRKASRQTDTEYVRLLREGSDLDQIAGIEVFPDALSAAIWLNEQKGTILLTTGIKELPVFAEEIDDVSRLYARVLLQEDVFGEMERFGLTRKQIICMQGPFSREMNIATMQMVHADYLVTKESGSTGGFADKLDAARELGVTCVVIRRPLEETGDSPEDIRQMLLEQWETYVRGEEIVKASESDDGFLTGQNLLSDEDDNPSGHDDDRDELLYEDDAEYRKAYRKILPAAGTAGDDSKPQTSVHPREMTKRKVSLVGIGLGIMENMTMEAAEACREADCIIGANRMLKTLSVFGKPSVALYMSDEIISYILEHTEYKHIVIGLSGDVGFYSGAKLILEKLKGNEEKETFDTQLYCGITTASYFASRLGMPWEDIVLASAHGRDQNIIGILRVNEKVFALASDASSVRQLAERLVNYGFDAVRMYVAVDLSYPTEAIYEGTAADFLKFDELGICAVLLCNPSALDEPVTYGIPDDAFIRGDVPMTKEEVRTISLSKLRLTRDAVIYDIGAGTGSVAVECARIADRGKVYAIEWKEEGWNLIARNRRKFGAANLEIVPGRAPEMLADLPAPTHAFIGGSSGSLKNILHVLLQKNSVIRIVVNCITLETLQDTMQLASSMNLEIEDIACINTAKARVLSGMHMMMGQNPVYVVTLNGMGLTDGGE